MIFFPNAKINIGLNIVEKRVDNFHNIETVFYPIGLSDILELVENVAGRSNYYRSTGIKIPGNNSNNLCLRAYGLISRDYPVPPVKIHLHKIIPIGAGLGGGSSDAAFFINLVNKYFSLGIPEKKRLEYASKLGSDCSFFIKNKVVFASGRGEKIKEIELSLSGYFILLVYPALHISTPDAYKGSKPAKPLESLEKLIKLPVSHWKDTVYNQFEETVFLQYPSLKKIKNKLYDLGAVYSSMSGSGSAVYGLFNELPPDRLIKKHFKDCFTWKERLR